MVGVIDHWDILTHPIVTIRSFGWRVFFRAIEPWQGRPLLSLLREAGYFGAEDSNVSTILERCVALELRAKRIYNVLARTFADHGLIGPFFAGLVEQEQYHADLLQICRAAALRCRWKANLFNPWQDYLPRLEQQMATIEAALPQIDSVETGSRTGGSDRGFRDQRDIPCRDCRHGFGLRQEAQAVSPSHGRPHDLHRRAAAGALAQVAVGLPRTAGEVSAGVEPLSPGEAARAYGAFCFFSKLASLPSNWRTPVSVRKIFACLSSLR